MEHDAGRYANCASIDQFSDVAIGKDGTAYLTWMRCVVQNQTLCSAEAVSLFVAKSSDGGNTWSVPVKIADVNTAPGGYYGYLPNTFERMFEIPVVAIDNSNGSNAGRLYVALYNWTGTFMQVQVVHSTDGGNTWSKAVPVAPPTQTHDQFLYWLNVGSGGTLAVTWLDRRHDPNNLEYQPFIAFSANCGTSFSTNQALSSRLSNPLNDGLAGSFMGDYRTNIWAGKTAYVVWMDTRTGNCQDEIGGELRKTSSD